MTTVTVVIEYIISYKYISGGYKMAEKRKVQKSAQTILNEKFAKGEITKDYFVRRTRELAMEAANETNVNSNELEDLRKEITRLNEVINNMSESAKEKERTYVEHIENLKTQLNSTEEENVETPYTNYEELRTYLDNHLLLVEGLDVETDKRLVTNVIIKGNKEDKTEKNYTHIAIAMVGMSCGPHLVLDDNGNLKEVWKLHTVTGKERDEFIEVLVDKLYSCELCRGCFGAISTFVSVGNRHDCSLYADDFDWYFDEQEQYLEETTEKEDSFEKDFKEDSCEGCENCCDNCNCEDKEEYTKEDFYNDLLGCYMLAKLFL